MAKCKWCGENSSTNKNGYCENCNDMIRGEILRNKEILEELAQKASPFLPDEEKDHIYQDTLTAYQNLMDFKRKQVPFFKSDPVEWANAVMKKLNLPEMESDVKKEAENKEAVVNAKSRKISIIITLLSFSFAILLVFGIYVNGRIDDYHHSISYVLKQNDAALGELGQTYSIGDTSYIFNEAVKIDRGAIWAVVNLSPTDKTLSADQVTDNLNQYGKLYAVDAKGSALAGTAGQIELYEGVCSIDYCCNNISDINLVKYVVVEDVTTLNGEKQNIVFELLDKERYEKVRLVVAAEETIKEYLKSPSTAEFPKLLDDYEIVEIPELENSYYVYGYVDAENSFGTMVRSDFCVKINYLFDQEKYKILDVQID